MASIPDNNQIAAVATASSACGQPSHVSIIRCASLGRGGTRLRLALAAAVGILAVPAQPVCAAVTLTFLSRDLGVDFPHAFVETAGATDAQPQIVIHANYGFTAKTVTPAILMGSVGGEIMSVSDDYVRGSDRHFSIRLSDAQYADFLRLLDSWRNIPSPSYNLHKRNCVHFVKAVADFVGLSTDHTESLMLKPRSFLDEIALENVGRLDMAVTYKAKLKASVEARTPFPSH
jgi:hypothetical protein